jgi:Tfp pilus assembly pilus retraction ATPase PilT
MAVHEILLRTPGLPNLIREGNIQMLASVIQGGKSEGMQAMDDVLFQLASENKIAGKDAYMKANDKARFERFAPAD